MTNRQLSADSEGMARSLPPHVRYDGVGCGLDYYTDLRTGSTFCVRAGAGMTEVLEKCERMHAPFVVGGSAK